MIACHEVRQEMTQTGEKSGGPLAHKVLMTGLIMHNSAERWFSNKKCIKFNIDPFYLIAHHYHHDYE